VTFAPQPAPAVAYPEGAPGIRMSVEAVAKMMRDGRLDASMRAWGIDVLTAAGFDGRDRPSIKAQAQALLAAFQKQTIYTSDPAGAEWIQPGHVTLCLRDRCIRGGDCDDLTSALGGAMLSIGLPAYAVKVSYGEGHQQHILVGLLDESGQGLYADPSTNRPIMTRVPNAVEEIWIDPLEQVGSIGTAGAEMVTLAKPMARDLYYRGGHWFEYRYGQWWMHAGGKWLPGPVDHQAKGLPGFGRPYKRGGAFWADTGMGAHVELRHDEAGLGTIFGWHTVHELQDLYNALTYQVGQITTAYNCGQAQWQTANATAYQAWTDIYNNALAAWNAEAANAQKLLTAPGSQTLENAVIVLNSSGKDEFDVLARAFDPFEELDRLLRKSDSGFPTSCLPGYQATPQPSAPDLDLSAYQIADSGWQAVKKVADKVGQGVEAATPYIALAAGAVALYAVYRVSEALPRRRV
jgi:hypothetical protein